MARDIFVRRFKQRLTQEQLQHFLEDFLGDAASSVKWGVDRFFVSLGGSYSFPFNRQPDITKQWKEAHEQLLLPRQRWIEVWVSFSGSDAIEVDFITRDMDEYTNTVAIGMAKAVARYWKGKIEE